MKYAWKQYFGHEDKRYRLNAYDVDIGWPRTSNSAEGFHSGLYEALRVHGSGDFVVILQCTLLIIDLRRLLATLNEVEFHTHYRLYQLSQGCPPRYRKDVYKELDKRIEKVKSEVSKI